MTLGRRQVAAVQAGAPSVVHEHRRGRDGQDGIPVAHVETLLQRKGVALLVGLVRCAECRASLVAACSFVVGHFAGLHMDWHIWGLDL